MTPDASKQGFIDLPEFPFGLEPRICTRWDMHRFAREAYNAGVRYIGGCCGFQAYHIRAIAEELEREQVSWHLALTSMRNGEMVSRCTPSRGFALAQPRITG